MRNVHERPQQLGMEGDGVMATYQEIIQALCCGLDAEKKCIGSGCPFFNASGEGGCRSAAIEAAIDRLEEGRKAQQSWSNRRGRA